MSSHIVSHLASERTIVVFPLSSMRATVAPARLQSKSTRLVTRLLDDQHSELNVEREQLLRPPPFQHRVNCLEKSDISPSAMVGSSFEHEGLCTRSSFKQCERQSDCKEVRRRFHHVLCWMPHVVLCEGESCWPRP